MSDEPRFSFFRLSIKPISSRDRHDSKSHAVSLTAVVSGEERKADIRRAFFFSGVAILLVLANHLGHVKGDFDSNSTADSVARVELALYPQQQFENHGGFVVRFRLSNMGNHPVFYPVRAGTNVPLGQIVTRTSPSSEWTALSVPSQQQGAAAPGYIDPNLAWIEMPPGGWVEGQFADLGRPGGDHAYLVHLKPEREAKVVSLVSSPYPVTTKR
ncbi:MAG TPA: hypothetical protein VGR97_14955 [Candidatus Acidoferrales bacterium]|nr:hypothetical protein [Candidatus Acidoferrales bacterium]